MPIQITSSDSEADVKAALGGQKLENKPEVKASETVTEEKAPVESKAESETAEEVEAEKPKKTNVQKRIDKLSKRAAEAERKAEYWELEAKRKASEPLPEKKVEAKVVGEPNADDFERHEDYVKALVKYEAKNMTQEQLKKAQEDALRAGMEAQRKEYAAKEKDFKEKNPDFQDRVDAVEDVEMSAIVRDEILEGGPELAYALSEDPKEFKRICSLSDRQALKEIGRLQAKTSFQSAEKLKIDESKEVKTKPKPVSPVGSKVTEMKDPNKMSIKEYDAWRRSGNSP